MNFESTMARLVVTAVLATTSGHAFAGTPEADRYNQQGRESYRAHRYTEAAEAFEKAYAASAESKYLFNAGKAYEMAGQFVTAIELFDDYLANQPEAANAHAVETTIAALRPKAMVTHGEIRFESVPSGATLTLESAGGQSAETPTRKWLPHGEHRLTANLEGYLPAERRFEVSAQSDTIVRVELVAEDAPGLIHIAGALPGSRIELDDRAVGVAPLPSPVEATPGRRKISVVSGTGRAFVAQVDLSPGEEITIQVAVEEPAQPSLTRGELEAAPIEIEATADTAGFEMPVSAWVTGGTALAASATAIALYLRAQDSAEEAASYSMQPGAARAVWQGKVDDAEGLLLGSELAVGIAGAAAVATGVILAIVNTDDAPTTGLLPVPLDGGGALVLSFTH